jgi:pimeloyl-ACP methyl ester carboxylesterase
MSVTDGSSADPLDPAIPVPDVPGGDAGAGGLPARSDLTLRQRLIVDSSALADIALRTGVASMVGVAMLPQVAASLLRPAAARAEADTLRFYADLAAAQDPAVSFPAPTTPPRISSRPANPVAEWTAHGRVHNIRFRSSFEAVNPAMRERGQGYRRNNIVHAQHWRHEDGPHPTLCVIHGFMGSAYLFNGLFLSLPWFYRSGYDVLLYTLPFHGARAERFSPYSGYGFFAAGFAGFAEAMAQAVHDFRSLVDYLEFTGVDRVAVTGISLGGFTSALLACVEDRLQAVIPNVPVVTPDRTVDEWFPANKLVALNRIAAGVDRNLESGATRYASPLNYPPLVPRDRRLIITGLGDRLAPPEQAEALWEHWERCAFHWFPGNHLLHVSQPDYLRWMTRFLGEFMFD